MDCLKKCGRKAEATPYMCSECFLDVAEELFYFSVRINDDDKLEELFKAYIRKVNHKTWKATRNLDDRGLVADAP